MTQVLKAMLRYASGQRRTMRSSMQVVRTVGLCEPLLFSRLACIPCVPSPSPGLLPQAPGQVAGRRTRQACGMETPHAHGARRARPLSVLQTLGVHLRTAPSADPQEAPTNGLCLPIVTARAGD